MSAVVITDELLRQSIKAVGEALCKLRSSDRDYIAKKFAIFVQDAPDSERLKRTLVDLLVSNQPRKRELV